MSQITNLAAGGAVPSAVNTLRGDVGGFVGPTGNNIDLIGGTGITTTGMPGSSSITFALSGSVATQFDGDSGSAAPAASIITFAGGSNVTSSAAGSTVTFDLDNTVSISGSLTAGTGLTATTGDVTVSAGNITVSSGSITSSATITSTGGNIIATTGNIEATAGTVTADGNITSNTGNLIATAGSVTGSGDITSTTGDLVSTAGNLTVGALGVGMLTSNASGNISSINGTDGQLIIGATGAAPIWANMVSGDSSITIATGANSLDIRTAGGIPGQFDTDSGSATPSSGVIEILGGSNINTAGAGNTVTVNLDTSIEVQAATIDPGASGDSALQFDINAVNEFKVGVDDSDDDKFKVVVGGDFAANNAFVIDSAGHVTKPLQSAFRAEVPVGGFADVTGDSTLYTVQFSSTVFDRNSDYNNSTYTFTAPVTGIYQFGTIVRVGGVVGTMTIGFLRFLVNGSIPYLVALGDPSSISTGGNEMTFESNIVLNLTASDTILVQLSISGGAKVVDISAVANASHFYGWLIA